MMPSIVSTFGVTVPPRDAALKPKRRFEHKLCHDCPAILNRLLGRPLSASLGTIMKRPDQVRYDPFRALFG